MLSILAATLAVVAAIWATFTPGRVVWMPIVIALIGAFIAGLSIDQPRPIDEGYGGGQYDR